MDSSRLSLQSNLKKHNIAPNKKLGQNFLSDKNLLNKIISFANITTEDTIIEVGPGPGKMTEHILEKKPKYYFAIEKDERLVSFLKEQFPTQQEKFIYGDALKHDFSKLGSMPRKVIANLPYNVATKLLLGWLNQLQDFSSLTLMFQKEVAERLVAQPKTKDYGRLAVVTQYVTHVKKCMTISPHMFFPPPQVDSAVVHIAPKTKRYYSEKISFDEFQETVKLAFQFRRKMLKANFKKKVSDIEAFFRQAEINPTLRAEDLCIEDFCHLTYAYQQYRCC